MTKGSGRSAWFRGGVTYGYREYLRKGRVRKSCVASSPVNQDSTDLRRALRSLELERSIRFHPPPPIIRTLRPEKYFSRCFASDRISRNIVCVLP